MTDTIVNRIQKLLDKAESTPYPEEAEALFAKAQGLMAAHAIDEAVLAASGAAKRDEIDTLEVVCEAPYASAKSALLGAVARANNGRVVVLQSGGKAMCTVVGHASDLQHISTLFSALSIHAVRALTAATVPPGDTPRRFRHAFLLAFAARINERLIEANQLAVTEHDTANPGQSAALVIKSRGEAVEDELHRLFPKLRTRRVSASSHAGFSAGKAAASNASLGQRGVSGGTRAIGAG